MTVFVELVTDAFEEAFRRNLPANQGGNDRSTRAGATKARRPVRGIEIKEDTYAYLRVVLPTGDPLPILDSSSATGQSTAYTNFILQSVTESRMERHQIVETFGDSYIFFFGEQPRFLDCSAVLINTHDFNWRAEWWHNYETYLRGTKLVELGARCYMFWDDVVVEGYMIQAQAQEQAESPYSVAMSFKFFVTKYHNVSIHLAPQNAQFPIRSSVRIPDSIELRAADSFYQLQNRFREQASTAQGVTAIPREVSRSEMLLGVLTGPGSEARTITSIVRQMPPSFIQDPAMWRRIVEEFRVAGAELAGSQSGAARSLISDNKDEFISGSEVEPAIESYYNSALVRQNISTKTIIPSETVIVGQEESDDLLQDIINSLESMGVQCNDPDAVNGLGLGPNFSQGARSGAAAYASARASATAVAGVGSGFSAGAGASAFASASFSPIVSASASAYASASAGAGASASVSASASAGFFTNSTAVASAGAFVGTQSGFSDTEDPLGSVYGRVDTDFYRFSSRRPQYIEGTGDYEYGYGLWASFGGVGYGKVGYGDFGGSGFGSCRSDGDPGFRDPSLFTFGGVGRNRAAYNRFIRTKADNTAMTRGPMFGGTFTEGAASRSVRGKQSSFSILGLEGTIESWVVEESGSSVDGSVVITNGRMWESELARQRRHNAEVARRQQRARDANPALGGGWNADVQSSFSAEASLTVELDIF